MSSTSQDQSIAASLRDDILRGQYRCGERLPSERDLAARFGVHRSTIREAFKRLEQLGVATIQPGGARVAPIEEASLDVVGHLLSLDDPPDPEIFDQALEATSAFRAMVARLGVERASPPQRERMLEIMREMADPDLLDERRAELVVELGDRFVEASGNMILGLMSRGLQPRRELAYRLLTSGANKAVADEYRDRLIVAIETADGPTASEAVYAISCLIRQSMRELASVEPAPGTAKTASGVES